MERWTQPLDRGALGPFALENRAFSSRAPVAAQAEHQGEQMTPYSFRHRHAKKMHAANVPLANVCQAMGYTRCSLEVVCAFQTQRNRRLDCSGERLITVTRIDRGRSFVRGVWPASPMVDAPTEIS